MTMDDFRSAVMVIRAQAAPRGTIFTDQDRKSMKAAIAWLVLTSKMTQTEATALTQQIDSPTTSDITLKDVLVGRLNDFRTVGQMVVSLVNKIEANQSRKA